MSHLCYTTDYVGLTPLYVQDIRMSTNDTIVAITDLWVSTPHCNHLRERLMVLKAADVASWSIKVTT